MAGHLRIPLVEQGEHSECGLAACAMILKAYGRDSGLEDLRNAYGVPRGGLSINNIVTILNDYGVTNRAVAVRNIDGFKKTGFAVHPAMESSSLRSLEPLRIRPFLYY